METHLLKRIIIITLALVNLALLALLGHNALQQRGAEQETLAQLQTLYASHGIELLPQSLPKQHRAASAVAVSDSEREQRFAAQLLGETKAQESGSATLYRTDHGTLRFRRNGFFELTVSRPSLFREEALQLFQELGYTLSDGGTGETVRLVQSLDRRVIAGGAVSLFFTDDLLTSAYGYYVAKTQEQAAAEPSAAADALSAFLQYVQESGLVCGSVQSVAPAWQLSAETLFQSTLLPVWLIETDAGCYYASASGSRILPLFETQS